MAVISLSVRVSGRVQGVWFRRFTQQKAEAYGVSGWVKNLKDGRVEALLQGEEKNVRQVEAWMSQGPELANVVECVSEVVVNHQISSSFVILEDDQ